MKNQTNSRFVHSGEAGVKTETIPVDIYSLRCRQNMPLLEGLDAVTLERKLIAVSISRDAQDEYVATQTAKKSRGAGNPHKEKKKQFLVDWPYPHLFR